MILVDFSQWLHPSDCFTIDDRFAVTVEFWHIAPKTSKSIYEFIL
jgi:hypothetical protein